MNVKHLFIINPVAGKKDRTEVISSAIKRVLPDEASREIRVTTCPSDATEIAREYILGAADDDFVRVYACGGDGTLSEVVLGIYRAGRSNCALGVIPIGSGNDFIKYYDEIPAEKFRSLADMVAGRTEEIDLLRVADCDGGNERVSINIVSAGFDAAVAKGMVSYKRLPMVNGSAAYNLSLCKCLVNERKHVYHVVADGEDLEDPKQGYLFVIAANGRYYGGGFKAAPISNIQDGFLDLIRICSVSISKFIGLVGKFRQGEHIEKLKEYTSHSLCKHIRIEAENPVEVNVDGEICEMKNPEISIVPRAVKLILPA